MIITKQISFVKLIFGSSIHIVQLSAFMIPITALYYFNIISVSIPWAPITIIGTAVSFYVGFKNNQSYDRVWEARKIWGGIVNNSRTWGMIVDGYITNQFLEKKENSNEIDQIKKKLIYRHIAWLYAHRSQLLVPTNWERMSQGGKTTAKAKDIQKKFGVGLLDGEEIRTKLRFFLVEKEHDRLVAYANTATQIINQQSRDLTELRARGFIDDFRHMGMENILAEFYTLQGKNERIKKFPFPRQYSSMSKFFVNIFIVLLPFSVIPQIINSSDWGIWISTPFAILIGWIYLMMEKVGDYSENPFEGMANDIPMMSLSRTIEIDLREMLGEKNLPSKIQPKNGILM